MGNKKSQLTKAELEDYKELTYLTKHEIQCAFTRFQNLYPKILNRDKYARIQFAIIKRMPEFQNNPFAERICDIFSSQSDQCWSFEDFLDMVSVFSPSAPADKKAEYAFNIYDFDGDGLLSEKDLLILMSLLKGNNYMDRPEMEEVIDKVMAEADIDQDGHLSLSEFKHILMKCPDFGRSFTIRI